jgi:ABC-type uncharacterized transport system involved in gliding motility auxiliary subunit
MTTRLLGVLSYLGMALVFGALAVRYLKPEWDQYALYATWAGLALVAAYAIGQWRDVVAFFGRRNARYGTLSGAMLLVVFGILVAVNYLSVRRNARWDLTANRQYSLADQTVKLLRGLTAPVKFLVFDQETNFERYRPRFSEFDYQSAHVDVQYVDAVRNPVQARQYNVESLPTIVIEYMGRTERVTSDAEQDLTNGLIKVLTPSMKKVYFVSGHGEKDTGDSDRSGYSTIAAALGRDNYSVEKLVLAQQKDVPADASVVVVAGPRGDLLEPEAAMLTRYLDKGGHVMVLVDPPDAKVESMPQLEGLLKAWSVDAGNNVVVDVSGVGQLLGTDASVPVAASYPSHAITDRFDMLTAYPLSRSVAPASGATGGRFAQTIIETSPRSWAEADVKQLRASGKVEMNADKGDKAGPVSIGVAVSAPVQDTPKPAEGDKPAEGAKPEEGASKPESRLVVIGDSDFASNAALGIQGNRDLFMNAVSWLAQQENLIAIRPREAADRRLTMTARTMDGAFWLSIVVIPAAVLGAGVYSWWRRR